MAGPMWHRHSVLCGASRGWFSSRCGSGPGGVEFLDDLLEVFDRVGAVHRDAIEQKGGGSIEAELRCFLHIRGDAVFYGLAPGVLLAPLRVDAEVMGGLL